MKYEHINESVADKRNKDRINSEAMQNKANIDYIAMMCDVEIPTEDNEVSDNE